MHNPENRLSSVALRILDGGREAPSNKILRKTILDVELNYQRKRLDVSVMPENTEEIKENIRRIEEYIEKYL